MIRSFESTLLMAKSVIFETEGEHRPQIFQIPMENLPTLATGMEFRLIYYTKHFTTQSGQFTMSEYCP